jgi:hypothetical protein
MSAPKTTSSATGRRPPIIEVERIPVPGARVVRTLHGVTLEILCGRCKEGAWLVRGAASPHRRRRRVVFREPGSDIVGRHEATVAETGGCRYLAVLDGVTVCADCVSVADAKAQIATAMFERYGLIAQPAPTDPTERRQGDVRE